MVKLFNADENTFKFMLKEVGKDLLLNGTETIRAILSSIPIKANGFDDKYLSTLSSISQGDLVDYNSAKWIVLSQVAGQRTVKYKGIMRKCSHSIKFNWEGNIRSFDAIITTKMLDIVSGTYITAPVGKVIITIQDNENSRNLILAQRFIIMNSAWKIVGIDRSSEGILVLNCDMTSFTDADDQNTMVADRWTWDIPHAYVLTIVNGESAGVNLSDIYTLTTNVTDNGASMTSPAISYFSSDQNIASVDNYGKVMGIGIGSCVINARMTNNPTVFDTIAITVSDAPVGHVFTIDITTYPTTIKVSRTGTFVCTVYDNGVAITSESATWSIEKPNPDGTQTNYCTITSQTGNSAVVTAGSNSSYANKYVNVVCSLVSDPTITTFKKIKIIGLY